MSAKVLAGVMAGSAGAEVAATSSASVPQTVSLNDTKGSIGAAGDLAIPAFMRQSPHNGHSSGSVQGMGNGSNVTPLHGGVGVPGNANYDESARSSDYFTGGGNLQNESVSLSGGLGAAPGNANYDEPTRSSDYFTGGGNLRNEPESLSGGQGSSGNDASLFASLPNEDQAIDSRVPHSTTNSGQAPQTVPLNVIPGTRWEQSQSSSPRRPQPERIRTSRGVESLGNRSVERQAADHADSTPIRSGQQENRVQNIPLNPSNNEGGDES
ncbi:hypothetical protein SAMN05428961_110101 [Paenibacillus sp. OK060]|uniref:hypothetical protein n=1 Tax=Paenibacillus sp. OK060 TaxID=1881034 RepID=UPI00088056AA|nr:hypothetical protein [Paenibacillus sp. OK060]SDM15724.1 hypothetical protein SAMN05428961_110101 [Paenibacillus sp. OK060]